MCLTPVCFGNDPVCSCLSFKEREAGTGKDCCSTLEVYTWRTFLTQLHCHPCWACTDTGVQAEMFFIVADSPVVTKPHLYWRKCTFFLLVFCLFNCSAYPCVTSQRVPLWGSPFLRTHRYGHAEINLFSKTVLVHWFGYKQVQSLQSRAFCWEGL